MATFVKIPLQAGIADQQLDVVLDGEPFTLRVTWNESGGYWYFTVSHRNGEAICDAVKMVKNVPLLNRYRLSSPAGDFIFLDNNSNKLRPDYASLGNDHLFLYRVQNS